MAASVFGLPTTTPAGGLVLLEQHTASSSASLDFTTCISASYDEYQIEFVNVLAATNAADFLGRVSTDGGSNWVSTSGHYGWTDLFGCISTHGAEGSITTQTSMKLNGAVSNANLGVCGTLRLIGAAGSGYKVFCGQLFNKHSTVDILIRDFLGVYLQSTAVNAFQFFFSTGNIASGTIRVYGLSK